MADELKIADGSMLCPTCKQIVYVEPKKYGVFSLEPHKHPHGGLCESSYRLVSPPKKNRKDRP